MQLPCEIDLKSVSTMLVLDDSLQEKIALSNMLEFKMVSELQPNQDHAVKPSFNVFPRKISSYTKQDTPQNSWKHWWDKEFQILFTSAES